MMPCMRQMRYYLVMMFGLMNISLNKVSATCTTSDVTAGFGPKNSGIESTTADAATCETSCTNNPMCVAFTVYSGTCDLHSGKTAYDLETKTDTSTQHTYMVCASGLWTYAGQDIGCGSTYIADMAATNHVSITATTRWSCWFQCLEYPRCAGWDWKDPQCSIYTDSDTLVGDTGTENHAIICPGEPYNSFLSGWNYYPMSLVKGGKLQSGTSASLIACQTACDAETTCRAIDWDVDWKRCWFHTSTGKDTSCVNFPIYSRNTYHMKKAVAALFCTTTDYPPAPFVTS